VAVEVCSVQSMIVITGNDDSLTYIVASYGDSSLLNVQLKASAALLEIISIE
jgi:hypothetical protein